MATLGFWWYFGLNIKKKWSIFAGLFLTLVMTLNSISLLFATLVINIKKKGERKPCPEVPPLVLAICRRVLARITCTRMLSFFDFYDICEPEIPSCDDGRQSGEDTEELSSIEDLTQPTTSRRARRAQYRGQVRYALHVHDQESLYKRARKNFVPPRDLKQEWYFVAQVLDKSLFILFFTGMTLTVVFPLIIIPYIHRNDWIYSILHDGCTYNVPWRLLAITGQLPWYPHPDSNVGWANVGPTSGRQHRRWAKLGQPTLLSESDPGICSSLCNLFEDRVA